MCLNACKTPSFPGWASSISAIEVTRPEVVRKLISTNEPGLSFFWSRARPPVREMVASKPLIALPLLTLMVI